MPLCYGIGALPEAKQYRDAAAAAAEAAVEQDRDAAAAAVAEALPEEAVHALDAEPDLDAVPALPEDAAFAPDAVATLLPRGEDSPQLCCCGCLGATAALLQKMLRERKREQLLRCCRRCCDC